MGMRSGSVQVEIVRPDGSRDSAVWKGSHFNRIFTEKRVAMLKIIKKHGQVELETLRDELFRLGYDGLSNDVLKALKVLESLTLVKIQPLRRGNTLIINNFKKLIVRV